MAASTELSTLDVVNALEKLTINETRTLAFHLKVPGYVLDNIDAQYDGTTRSIKYVEEWLKYDEDSSWEKLVSGLKRIRMNAVAKEVESLYILEKAPVAVTGTTPLVSVTSPSWSSVETPAKLEVAPLPPMTTATVEPATPAINPTQSPQVSTARVREVEDQIQEFKDEFFDLKFDAKEYLSEKETQEVKFLAKFRSYLLDLPISKRAVHARFFDQNKDEISKADNTEKIFDILRPYCNYSNYDIILHLIKKFCDAALKKRMLDYRDSFKNFEMTTMIDIFLCAISASQEGEIHRAFSQMVMTIDKPASECTLHEIRQLTESLVENADVHSYSAYIESVATGSVLVVLRIPQSCVVWVGMAMTPDFMYNHHLREASIDGEDITYYQDREYLV